MLFARLGLAKVVDGYCIVGVAVGGAELNTQPVLAVVC